MWFRRAPSDQYGMLWREPRRRTPQRVFVDVLVGVAIVALVAIFMDVRSRDDARQEAVVATRAALRSLAGEIRLRGVLAVGAGGDVRFPTRIESDWFGDEPPLNALLDADRPWIEVAAPHEYGLRHPTAPVASGRDAAAFWYNPANGEVRARVPESLSEAESIALYNRVNLCKLRELRTVASVEDRESR